MSEKDKRVFGPKFAVLTIVGFLVVVAVVLVPAGKLNWAAGWTYILLTILSWVVMIVLMARRNPDLLKRRMSIGEGTKQWDRTILALFRILSIAIFTVAGMDAVRFGWSSMWPGFWLLGFFLHSFGYSLATWSMLENPHFEGTVRIQHDRDHQVVDTGPYSFVRHPGYVGFFLALAAVPFLLGSWWAFVPVILFTATIILRTWLEDRTLSRELPGYDAYALRVRYRLLPWIW